MTSLGIYLRCLCALWRVGLLRLWPWTAFLVWLAWRRCRGSLAFLAEVATLRAGARVALVDDLLATGGTAGAAIRLLRALDSDVVGAAFVIELAFLQGRAQLSNVPCHVLVTY